MRRLHDMLLLVSVASAFPAATLVLGHAQDVLTPATPVQPPVQKKAVQPARPDAAKKQAAVKLRAAEVTKAIRAIPLLPAQAHAAQAGNVAAIDAQAAQYVQHFRPLFRSEYYFIRNACDLSTDQRKQLARLRESVSRGAAKSFVVEQQKMMRGGWRPGSQYPDPRQLMEQELARAITPLLSAEQVGRYKTELEKRIASRKQLVIDNLIAKLDEDLMLTADQRIRLVRSLTANWKDSWGQSLEMLMNLENFFPSIPDQLVMPILTEPQRDAWRRVPRNTNVFWGFSFGAGNQENDPLDDPELADAGKAGDAGGKRP